MVPVRRLLDTTDLFAALPAEEPQVVKSVFHGLRVT